MLQASLQHSFLFGKRSRQQRRVSPHHLLQLRERKRIFSKASLDREAGTAEALEKPVLEARVSRSVGRILQRVARGGGQGFAAPARAGRLKVQVAPVDDPALGVQRDDEVGRDALREPVERAALGRCLLYTSPSPRD